MQFISTSDRPDYFWPKGTMERIVTGLVGFITVMVALKTAEFGSAPVANAPLWEIASTRALAFCALTIWATFTIGVARRGVAAMTVMVFAAFLEFIVMPEQGKHISSLAASASSIVLAYLAFHFYWKRAINTDSALFEGPLPSNRIDTGNGA